MSRRAWKKLVPDSLRAAIELTLEFARTERRLSVDRVADRMGLASKWVLYKWLENGRLPATLIRTFEHACDCPHLYVTRYLAHSAHQLVIPMPTGRVPAGADIHALQAALTDAVGGLLDFAEGRRSAPETLGGLTSALEALAFQREQIARCSQPELEFGNA